MPDLSDTGPNSELSYGKKYVDDAELGVLFIVILKILEVNTVLVNGKE